MKNADILLASRSGVICTLITHLMWQRFYENRVSAVGDEDALEARLAKGKPDLLFLERNFADDGTVALTARLSRKLHGLRIVVFALDDCPPRNAALFIRRGAESFISFRSTINELDRAGTLIMNGKRYLPAPVKAALSHREMMPEARGALTKREKDVGRLIAGGLSIPQIAAALSLSPKTVDTHRGRLYEKTNSQKRSEFVAYAMRTGLVPGEDECLSN